MTASTATSSLRRVLVYSPLPHTSQDLCDAVRRQPWVKAVVGVDSCVLSGRDLTLQLEWADSLEQTMDRLLEGYFDLVVVDIRNLLHRGADPAGQEQAVDDFFSALRSQRDRERRFPRGRIAILIGDQDEERGDRLLFTFGRRHVGACLRDASIGLSDPARVAAARDRFIANFWAFCRAALVERRTGKKAVNLAGGGITGMYYHLGVLKCLDDAFAGAISDFDLFAGVSGGAVIAACLANGLSIDEMICKLGTLDASWKYDLKLSWRHLNVVEVPRRLLLVQREMLRYALRIVKREDDLSVASILGTWAVLFGPVFDNAEFEEALEDLFSEPGRSNDFRALDCELIVGATDQDRREHVVFSANSLGHVPISRAVVASAAMHPFFPSVEIDGRRYTDGIVTRTSNLGESIVRGADLVFAVDPFVPVIADEAGYNSRRGNMWVVEQDYKTMSFTRFAQFRDQFERTNPHVNIYTYLPSNRMRYLMSKQNPFVARNFHPIVCEAYRSTYRRLKTLAYKMVHELAAHDITLDLDPVEAKVARLRAAAKPDVRLLLDDQCSGRSSVA